MLKIKQKKTGQSLKHARTGPSGPISNRWLWKTQAASITHGAMFVTSVHLDRECHDTLLGPSSTGFVAHHTRFYSMDSRWENKEVNTWPGSIYHRMLIILEFVFNVLKKTCPGSPKMRKGKVTCDSSHECSVGRVSVSPQSWTSQVKLFRGEHNEPEI